MGTFNDRKMQSSVVFVYDMRFLPSSRALRLYKYMNAINKYIVNCFNLRTEYFNFSVYGNQKKLKLHLSLFSKIISTFGCASSG